MAITKISSAEQYDVCICGAGLAGLCLARQLKLEMPSLKILLVDKDARPLANGTHKVGESSIEVGSHYFCFTLGLYDYMDRIHKHKCALRFFTKDGTLPIEERTEFGTIDFPLIPAVQIDRGVLENDLRQMAVDMGIDLCEGVLVDDIRLAQSGEGHEIDLRLRDRQVNTVRATWVVDAMGRRRFLAKRLGLMRDVTHKASACWWRIPGEWNVTDSVTGDDRNGWRGRELGKRWYATNHFMGYGYWVWFIPVASHTSVGIVADENIHPIAERSTIQKALGWLERHEPHVARWIKDARVDDFLALKNFAHASSQFYSAQRWALAGEAAMFADPYYSTGSDLIALQNNVIVRMIRRDRQGSLTESDVASYNGLVAEVFRGALALYDGQYPVFGSEYLQNTKTMWDYDYLLGAMGKLGFAPHVLDEVDQLPELTRMMKRWADLNVRVQKLLRDWEKMCPRKPIKPSEDRRSSPSALIVPSASVFQNFTDQLRMRDAATLTSDCLGSALRYFEGRAVWMFKKAINDLPPSSDPTTAALIERARAAAWLNPNGIDLDPSTWESGGLFETSDARVMDEQMEYFSSSPPNRESLILGQRCPHELFWSKVDEMPHATAVVGGGRRYSYRDLGVMAASVCHHLRESYGLRSGMVAMVGEPSVEMLAVWLGAASAGLGFGAVARDGEMQWRLRDIGPALTVSSEPSAIGRTVGVADLIDGVMRPPPALPAPTLANRMVKSYSRHVREGNSITLRTITSYSLTNLCVYEELALRQHMAIHTSEDKYPNLVLATLTRAGQDWLLPLAFGGTLVIPPSRTDAAVFAEVAALAEELGGQPVIAGVPEELLAAAQLTDQKQQVSMLAIDRPLKTAESAVLARKVTAVVNGGVIAWGYEHLWTEDIKQSLAQEGCLL